MTTFPRSASPEEVEVSGSERTTFYPTVQALAQEFRLAIRPDSHPEAGHYYRSDHFSLARVGIPAFSVNEGVKYKGHDAAWGMQQANEYTEKHYHQPSDEYHPDIGFHWRCGDGPLRLCPGLGGGEFAESGGLAKGRRVRGGQSEERYELIKSGWFNVVAGDSPRLLRRAGRPSYTFALSLPSLLILGLRMSVGSVTRCTSSAVNPGAISSSTNPVGVT